MATPVDILDTPVDIMDTPDVLGVNLPVIGTAPSIGSTHLYICLCSCIGIAFALSQFFILSRQKVVGDPNNDNERYYKDKQLDFIFTTITRGAKAFLFAEYVYCAVFIVVFGVVVLVLVAHPWANPAWLEGGLTAISFVVGCCVSILSGYIGMMVAVFSNARTAVAACHGGAENPTKGWTASFNLAYRAGNVMGFSLCGLSLIILYILCLIYKAVWGISGTYDNGSKNVLALFECIAGYGLGGSCIAMFGRVGGGVFTKAADVGADLAGKVVGVQKEVNGKIVNKKLDEDSPYNPACIADNVGDNVGDVAGMGSDLFGSFGEASCAALLVGASVSSIGGTGITSGTWAYLMFPLTVSATGILVCLVVSFVATHIHTVKKEEDVETVLKIQLLLTSLVLTGVMYPVSTYFLPPVMDFTSAGGASLPGVLPWLPYICVLCGLWGGCIIGFITEYFTSHSYTPVRDVAKSTETGAATNIIYGLALGYKSVILPAMIIAAIIFVTFRSCGMYGIALGALGMLATLSTCLSIDVYGPVCDNAGGIAEMVCMPEFVRDKTDALDAAGNTTAAIGKGFAIGSAALVSLALFGAFITRSQNSMGGVIVNLNLLQPIVFAFLLFGAMVPYWFSALTMRSVGEAANKMVLEVARQFETNHDLKKIAGFDHQHEIDAYFEKFPNAQLADYAACIKISTDASLREMIPPGMLVIMTPVLVGIFFGVEAVAGLLGGAMVSATQLAISMSNTGGAWDNAKKFCEKGELNGFFKYDKGAKNYGAMDWVTGDSAFDNKHHEGNLRNWLKKLEANDREGFNNLMHGKKPIIDSQDRKFIYAGKKSDAHDACVTGDTVGDPLKDTSGPALNIVMKLMAIISVVFASTFISINNGRGIFNIGHH